MIVSRKPKRLKEWLPVAFLLVVGVVVCLLIGTPAVPVESPIEKICPYQTETQTCPYQLDR